MEKQVKKDDDDIQRPSMALYFSEGFRAFGERMQSFKFRHNYKSETPGDGHPVLVIPGFMASDQSTKPLRKFIKRLGYEPYAWGLGRNLGNLEDLVTLANLLEELYEKHQQKIMLIGWSLGGVYARQLAKEKSHLIRQVMTLGAPFRGAGKPNNAEWVYQMIKKGKKITDLDKDFLADLVKPAPVPTTAIYSKKDGVVPWKVCMEKKEDAIHQNVEVVSSHFGFGFNPEVFRILVDRIPYTEKNWQRYQPKDNVSTAKA